MHKVSSAWIVLAVAAWFLLSALTAGGESCDVGRQLALQGDAPSAIANWEKLSSDKTPKEKLRAVMTCLRNSGIASTNEDAAKWVIDVAAKYQGHAVLYAGMLYASGAGVPQDLDLAQRYLLRARELRIPQADEMLQIFTKGRQQVEKGTLN